VRKERKVCKGGEGRGNEGPTMGKGGRRKEGRGEWICQINVKLPGQYVPLVTRQPVHRRLDCCEDCVHGCCLQLGSVPRCIDSRACPAVGRASPSDMSATTTTTAPTRPTNATAELVVSLCHYHISINQSINQSIINVIVAYLQQ